MEAQHRAADFASPGMLASQVERRPAELSCPCPVTTAENMFAMHGGCRLSVKFIAGTVAKKASAEERAEVDVTQAGGLLARQGDWRINPPLRGSGALTRKSQQLGI